MGDPEHKLGSHISKPTMLRLQLLGPQVLQSDLILWSFSYQKTGGAGAEIPITIIAKFLLSTSSKSMGLLGPCRWGKGARVSLSIRVLLIHQSLFREAPRGPAPPWLG